MSRRRCAQDESGFTLLETSIAGLILSLVLAAVLGVLDSGTKGERRLQKVVDNQEAVRLALTAVARDLRAAEPLLPLTDVTSYPYRIEARLGVGTSSGPRHVRWSLDGATGSLIRHTITGANGSVIDTTYRLDGVHNVSSGVGVPLFRYYNSAGTELTSTNATTTDFANCSIRVHIELVAAAQAGPQPFASQSDVQLRNRLPGGIGC